MFFLDLKPEIRGAVIIRSVVNVSKLQRSLLRTIPPTFEFFCAKFNLTRLIV